MPPLDRRSPASLDKLTRSRSCGILIGPGGFQDGLDLTDDARRAAVLRAIEQVERAPLLLGASSPLIGIGVR